MKLLYRQLEPWTPKIREAVAEIAADLDPRDHEELRGLRGHFDPEALVQDVANVVRSGQLLDSFVAYRPQPKPLDPHPVAFGMAYRSTIPRVAELAFVGRQGEARAMAECYRELGRRANGWGVQHGVALAQVPILASHRAARRKARETGAEEAFDYGAVGFDNEAYVHCVWRWVGEEAL